MQHQVAWQVFDAKVEHLLRDEYRIRQVTKYSADTPFAAGEMAAGICYFNYPGGTGLTAARFSGALPGPGPLPGTRAGRGVRRSGCRPFLIFTGFYLP